MGDRGLLCGFFFAFLLSFVLICKAVICVAVVWLVHCMTLVKGVFGAIGGVVKVHLHNSTGTLR